MNVLPLRAVYTLAARWPEYLELGVVRHSDECFTVSILDEKNRYLTMRLNLSLDDRWTVVPVAGFDYDAYAF